jgi:peptide deformylase
MAVKSILIEPNKLLRQVSKAVEKVGKEEKKLMDDMLDTMYAENGIGLAAIQIGVPKRIIVMYLNEEGCLSVPNQFAEIDRPNKCDVEYLDYKGEKKVLHADGLLATCIQHEMDHLEGILFIDYLSKLKKSIIIKKLSKLKSDRAVL